MDIRRDPKRDRESSSSIPVDLTILNAGVKGILRGIGYII